MISRRRMYRSKRVSDIKKKNTVFFGSGMIKDFF